MRRLLLPDPFGPLWADVLRMLLPALIVGVVVVLVAVLS